MDSSFPFLQIAKWFNLPYSEVVREAHLELQRNPLDPIVKPSPISEAVFYAVLAEKKRRYEVQHAASQ